MRLCSKFTYLHRELFRDLYRSHGKHVCDMPVGIFIPNLRAKRCIFLLLIFLTVGFLFFVFKIGKKSCSRKQGQEVLADLEKMEHIQRAAMFITNKYSCDPWCMLSFLTDLDRVLCLCLQYKSKKITGSLCHELCDLQTLKYSTCIAAGANKNVILMMKDGANIVLKSRLREPSNRYPLTAWELDDQNKARTVAPDVGLFEEMIYSEVSALFNTKIPENGAQLLSLLSDVEYGTENFTPTLSFMNTLMNLVQQEEYVNFKYRRTLVPFPAVFGYCGSFYGVEFFPPDKMLSSVSFASYSSSMSWKDRLKIALSLIDMVSSLDGNLETGESATHMCDVKADNFGVGNDLSVKVIDGDMIFSSAKMKSLLEAADCRRDSDCDFFDCEGVCDTNRGRCTTERRNFNIQVLCRDILSTGIHGTQLLRNPPKAYKAKIEDAITQCQSFTKEDVEKGWNPSWTLKQLLLQSCEES